MLTCKLSYSEWANPNTKADFEATGKQDYNILYAAHDI